MIPAASLLPGQQVNVCLGPMEEGVSHRALLTTHPDCTSKDIHYNVDIESIEGMPQTDSLLVSNNTKKQTLKAKNLVHLNRLYLAVVF